MSNAARGAVLLAAGLLALALVRAHPGPAPAARDSGRNVILLTWDGLRRDEFLDPALLPYFWGELAPTGRIYGDPRRGDAMLVGNPTMVSLPAYQSIFAGAPQTCQGNDCGQTYAHTFAERLVSELNLPRQQVATIGSWEGLLFAVEGRPGTTFVNAGPHPLADGGGDAELAELNRAQAAQRPDWADARFDEFTWRQAMRYRRAHHPRFLYISLNDADAWGHKGNYVEYLAAMHRYDRWLAALVADLAADGAAGRNTCLLITTDHGRGRDNWTTHSNGAPYSALVMMYAGCPLAPDAAPFAAAPMLTSHLDIRPTIEALFGLAPTRCVLCGTSLAGSPGVPPAL